MTQHWVQCGSCGTSFRPGERHACAERAEVDRALGDGSHIDAKRLYAEPADVSLAEAYWPEGLPPGVPVTLGRGTDGQFLADVFAEVTKARAKFPNNGSLITGLALGEESGEAQRALLHIYEGKSAEGPLYLECVQTAAMALRLALESADRVNWLGNERKRVRDSLVEIAEPPRFPRRAD